eukprot:TRINITY_DN54824_c0_g1_i1.p1 TRINITY_DN54824_c0_g1~~TRINITY_DN54824_c0_g1_i1.p1  ORF type:complete len:337 (+),score=54.66 TRINITY_DN54824_c0_g1_i1:102-1112(+)
MFFFFFFFKQKTAYEMLRSLVGSEMCIRDRSPDLRAALRRDQRVPITPRPPGSAHRSRAGSNLPPHIATTPRPRTVPGCSRRSVGPSPRAMTAIARARGSDRSIENRSTHCGEVPRISPKCADARDEATAKAVLDGMTRSINIAGVQDSTWISYQKFEQRNPSEIKVHEDIRTYPNCLRDQPQDCMMSTSTRNFRWRPLESARATRWKDGLPMEEGQSFADRVLERQMRVKPFVSGILPLRRGCELRCKAANSPQRPGVLNGGWAPPEYWDETNDWGMLHLVGRAAAKMEKQKACPPPRKEGFTVRTRSAVGPFLLGGSKASVRKAVLNPRNSNRE